MTRNIVFVLLEMSLFLFVANMKAPSGEKEENPHSNIVINTKTHLGMIIPKLLAERQLQQEKDVINETTATSIKNLDDFEKAHFSAKELYLELKGLCIKRVVIQSDMDFPPMNGRPVLKATESKDQLTEDELIGKYKEFHNSSNDLILDNKDLKKQRFILSEKITWLDRWRRWRDPEEFYRQRNQQNYKKYSLLYNISAAENNIENLLKTEEVQIKRNVITSQEIIQLKSALDNSAELSAKLQKSVNEYYTVNADTDDQVKSKVAALNSLRIAKHNLKVGRIDAATMWNGIHNPPADANNNTYQHLKNNWVE